MNHTFNVGSIIRDVKGGVKWVEARAIRKTYTDLKRKKYYFNIYCPSHRKILLVLQRSCSSLSGMLQIVVSVKHWHILIEWSIDSLRLSILVSRTPTNKLGKTHITRMQKLYYIYINVQIYKLILSSRHL